MTAEAANPAARVNAGAIGYPRRRHRIRGSSVAILVFLTMCAAFVAIPLYVIIVTSFKTIDQITLGEIFS